MSTPTMRMAMTRTMSRSVSIERSPYGYERRNVRSLTPQRYIWGVTAGIMKNMHQKLFTT